MHTMNNGENEYCLRWHKHFDNFISSFEDLLSNGNLTDVSFLVDEGLCIKAHKVVLCFCSKYFQKLFTEINEKYPIIVLKDVQSEHLKMLLEFMYTGQVNIPQDALTPLMNVAQSLQIKGLADGVVKVEKRPENENAIPMSLIHPKIANNSHYSLASHSQTHSDPKPSRPIPPMYNTPSTSVLSSALTMPSALSLASPLSLPHLASLPPSFASSLASTFTSAIPQAISSFLPPCEMQRREDSHSPMVKRRRRHRRKSGEIHDSGDSDARSSGSPGDSVPNISLPKIPATITPIGLHRQHLQHLNSQIQQQQQPRDLSMHSSQNQTNTHSNHDRPVRFSPHRERSPSVKIPPNIPGLLHHPSVENHGSPQEEPENLEHRPQKHIKLEDEMEDKISRSRNEERLNSQSTYSSPQEEKSSPVTSGRSEEGPAPLRISPKFSSDPESLVSPAKGLHSRLEETSSDNNHFSEDDRDENNTTASQKENSNHDRLSDSTPGPSTSRPHSEEAPPTHSLLGWPYSTDPNLSDDHYSSIPSEAAHHEYVKALFTAGLTSIIPQRPDLYARPSAHMNLPFLLKGRSDKTPKNLYSFNDTAKQFPCDKCGRSYASTGNLKRHKKYECGVEPQFSCPICQKKFQHRHSVKIHVYSTHRNESGEPVQEGSRESQAIYPTTESIAQSIAQSIPQSIPPVGGTSSWIPQGAPAPAPQQQE